MIVAGIGRCVGNHIATSLLDIDVVGHSTSDEVHVTALHFEVAVERIGTSGTTVDVREGSFDGNETLVGMVDSARGASSISDTHGTDLRRHLVTGVGALVFDALAIASDDTLVDNVTHDNHRVGEITIVQVRAGSASVFIQIIYVSTGLHGNFVTTNDADDGVRNVSGGKRGRSSWLRSGARVLVARRHVGGGITHSATPQRLNGGAGARMQAACAGRSTGGVSRPLAELTIHRTVVGVALLGLVSIARLAAVLCGGRRLVPASHGWENGSTFLVRLSTGSGAITPGFPGTDTIHRTGNVVVAVPVSAKLRAFFATILRVGGDGTRARLSTSACFIRARVSTFGVVAPFTNSTVHGACECVARLLGRFDAIGPANLSSVLVASSAAKGGRDQRPTTSLSARCTGEGALTPRNPLASLAINRTGMRVAGGLSSRNGACLAAMFRFCHRTSTGLSASGNCGGARHRATAPLGPFTNVTVHGARVLIARTSVIKITTLSGRDY